MQALMSDNAGGARDIELGFCAPVLQRGARKRGTLGSIAAWIMKSADLPGIFDLSAGFASSEKIDHQAGGMRAYGGGGG